jgi:hypothetical protein
MPDRGELKVAAGRAVVGLSLIAGAREDQSRFVGRDYRLCAVAQPELVEHPADVCLDRFLGDDETVDNLRI